MCLRQNDPRPPLLSVRSFRQDKMEHFPQESFFFSFSIKICPLKAFYNFGKTKWNTFQGLLLLFSINICPLKDETLSQGFFFFISFHINILGILLCHLLFIFFHHHQKYFIISARQDRTLS